MIRSLCFTLSLGLGMAQAGPVLQVTSAEVSYADQTAEVSWTGVIEAIDRFDMGFLNGGQILAIHVEAGDTVWAGDLLAELDPTQAREALRGAEAQLAAAEASLLRQERELERDQKLAAQGYVSQVALDQALEAVSSAKTTRTQAATQVQTARQAVTNTELIAAKPAQILQRNAEVGQVVGPAQSVLELADLLERDVVFIAPSNYDLTALLGQTLELVSLEQPSRRIGAKIYNIADMIDSATGGVRVTAQLGAGASNFAMINEAFEVAVPLPLGRVAALPATALTRDGQGPAAWVINDDQTVTLTPVTVAHYTTDFVFIAPSLPEGARVVVDGAGLLYPDRKVADRPLAAKVTP